MIHLYEEAPTPPPPPIAIVNDQVGGFCVCCIDPHGIMQKQYLNGAFNI